MSDHLPQGPRPAPGAHVPARYRETWLALQDQLGGRYALQEVLGEGGMGMVFLARERKLDRLVALKILPPAMATDRRRERFLREARVSARLRHEHIVPIHAVDVAGPFVYYTMDYIRGITLAQRLMEGPLPLPEAMRMLRDIAGAVQCAHHQGIIHRDLKPNNILIERETGKVYVADFGLAWVLTESPVLGTGRTFGTFAYVSPEQAAGNVGDRRSDVYALGVLAWVMTTGRPPFIGTVQEVLNHHRYTAPPALPVVGEDLDPTLVRVVSRCLVKHPDRRYQDAGEVAAALSEAVALSATLPKPLGHFVNRLTTLGQHGIAALAVVVLFGVAFVRSLARAGQWGWATGATVGLALMLAWPVLGALPETRHLLGLGYTLADLRLALRLDLNRQRRALAERWGPDADKKATWFRRLAVVGFGVLLLGFAVGELVPSVPERLVIGTLWGGLAGLAGGGGLLLREWKRNQITGRRWQRFWNSALGAGVVRLAGMGKQPLRAEHESVALPPSAEAPDGVLEGPRDLADALHLVESSLRRIQTFREAMLEARARSGREATPDEDARWRALEQQVVMFEAVAARLRKADEQGAEPGTFSRELEAAREVWETVEGLIAGLEWVRNAV